MLCPKCDKNIPEGSKFCLECGTDVSGARRGSGGGAAGLQLGGTAEDPSLVDSLSGLGGKGRPDRPDEPLGAEVDERYELMEEIGRGGFAVVHRALDTRLGRIVAVKRLLPQNLTEKGAESTIQRFMREARTIAALSHRNIVQVFDYARDSKGHYIVMEYIGGGTLREYLRKQGRLPVGEALQLMGGICRGLWLAHRANLVHRDIKPANILLAHEDDETIPKIVDFGLARSSSDGSTSSSGHGMGTLYYMAPEQGRDAKNVSHTADLYSLGKTLYQMVTGEVPHNVDVNAIPPPADLSRVILKCIKTRPQERFFSADELLKALEAVVSAPPQEPEKPVDPAAENLCPSCDIGNPRGAKFCLRCGTGLVRDCPECGHGNSVHSEFCAECGTGVQHFIQAQDALTLVEQLMEGCEWQQVYEEINSLPEDLRLGGPRGRELRERLLELKDQAKSLHASRARLSKEVHEALGREDLERALELVTELREIDPVDEDIEALAVDLPRGIDDRDYARAEGAAVQSESRGDFRGAIRSYETYLEQYPLGANVGDCVKRIQAAMAIEEAERDIEELLLQAGFDEARTILEGLEQLMHPKSRSRLVKAVDGLEEDYLRVMADVQRYRDRGDLRAAELACERARDLCPECPAPRELMGEIKSEKLRAGRSAEDVRAAIRAARFDDAREKIRKARECWPELAVLAELEVEVAEGEERYVEAIANVRFYRRLGQGSEAQADAHRALEQCPDSPEARELAANPNWLRMLVRRAAGLARRGLRARRRPAPSAGVELAQAGAEDEATSATACPGAEEHAQVCALRSSADSEMADDEPTPQARVAGPARPRLILRSPLRGMRPNQHLPIDESSAAVGGTRECSIRLSHRTVSNRHAELERVGAEWHVTDLDSRHGVFVNGERVEPFVPYAVGFMDRIRFGAVEVWFVPEEGRSVMPRSERAERRARRSSRLRKAILVLLCVVTSLAALLGIQVLVTWEEAEAPEAAEVAIESITEVELSIKWYRELGLPGIKTQITRLRESLDDLVRLSSTNGERGRAHLRFGKAEASEKVVVFCQQLVDQTRDLLVSPAGPERLPAVDADLACVETVLSYAGNLIAASEASALRRDVQVLRDQWRIADQMSR